MSYAVVWTPTAEAALTSIWLGARDRFRVREAADRLEGLLVRDPLAVGESRTASFRVIFEPPLVVQYGIDPAARTVTIVQVARTKR